MPNRTPRIGVLGHHAGALRRHAARASPSGRVAIWPSSPTALEGVAECVVEPPARNRADIERVMREYERQGLDGVLIVMLTYGPGQRVARALAQTRLPLCLANIQPEPR